MSAYTFGRWIVDGGAGLVQIKCTDVLVADVWGDDYERQAANANLIAAAPDLLTALRNLTAYVALITFNRTGGVDPDEIADARAAIAKAEGRL